MKDSIDRVCTGCWAVVITSLRMILTLGTLLYLVFTALLSSHSTHIENSLMVDPSKAGHFSVIFYINNGFSFLIALVGLYGLINNNHVALKAFPNMLFATTIMLSLYLIFGTAYTTDVSSARNEYMKLLSTYMSPYDWTGSIPAGSDNNNQVSRATEAWDSAQSEKCCGIDNYKDWDKYRPANISSNLYPKSCCPVAHSVSTDNPGLYCISDSDLYQKGCAKLGAEFWSLTLIFYTVFLIYQITIGTLAWFYWHQMRPGNGIIFGRTVNSQPEIPISWPAGQPQSFQYENNFSSPIYPDINVESPPPYTYATKDSHVHKI